MKRAIPYILAPFVAGIFTIICVRIFAALSGLPQGADFSTITFTASILMSLLTAGASLLFYAEDEGERKRAKRKEEAM